MSRRSSLGILNSVGILVVEPDLGSQESISVFISYLEIFFFRVILLILLYHYGTFLASQMDLTFLCPKRWFISMVKIIQLSRVCSPLNKLKILSNLPCNVEVETQGLVSFTFPSCRYSAEFILIQADFLKNHLWTK